MSGVKESDVRATLDAIRRLVQSLRASARRSKAVSGLTTAELFVVHALVESPARSLNELAARTYTDQSTASPIVERLRHRGLLRRERSADDGRRVVIALTAAGRAAVSRLPESPQSAMIAALERLPLRERRALARGLTALISEMGLSEKRPTMLFDEPASGGR